MKKLAIGVDIGGSHVSCMAYDLHKKNLLTESFAKRSLDNHGQPKEVMAAWGNAIQKTIDFVGVDKVAGIGFAMPGPLNYVKGISYMTDKNGKYENIYGVEIPAMLRDYLGLSEDFKIRFINDATAFAIGEDQIGKAQSFSSSLSVTLGTGLGAAFIKEGMPVVEGPEVPENGCLWHLPFEDGIADDYFSTRGLISRFEKATGEKMPGVKQIAEMAAVYPEAIELFDDFGTKMGMLLLPWIKKFGIEILILGGNVSRAYHLFGASLSLYLEQANLQMEIAVSELKETASFIGAATLVDDTFYRKILPILIKM